MKLKNPLILPLDVDTEDACLRLVEQTHDRVGCFKLGPRLMVRYGAKLSIEIAARAPVFIDNKYLDIPNTMEGAVRASFDAGASLVTIHAWSGGAALERLARVEAELNAKRPFKILAVTILTSYSPDTLPPPLNAVPIEEQVEDLARLAIGAGLSGLVCSPHEVALLRLRFPSAFLVTPGVRMPGGVAGDDQARVMTPFDAMKAGSSALVVGRPIYAAADPRAAAEEILKSLGGIS